MLVTVVAHLCLIATPDSCVDKVVTDQASLMQCGGAFAQQALATWLEENGYTARGYRLASWGCQIGKRAVSA